MGQAFIRAVTVYVALLLGCHEILGIGGNAGRAAAVQYRLGRGALDLDLRAPREHSIAYLGTRRV